MFGSQFNLLYIAKQIKFTWVYDVIFKNAKYTFNIIFEPDNIDFRNEHIRIKKTSYVASRFWKRPQNLHNMSFWEPVYKQDLGYACYTMFTILKETLKYFKIKDMTYIRFTKQILVTRLSSLPSKFHFSPNVLYFLWLRGGKIVE